MACYPMAHGHACEVCTHNSQRFESYDYQCVRRWGVIGASADMVADGWCGAGEVKCDPSAASPLLSLAVVLPLLL